MRPSILHAALLPLVLVAQPATVSITSAALHIDPTATDSYNLQGTFSGLSFSGVQTVTFTMGQFSGTLQMSSFFQQPGTNLYAYRDSTGQTPYWLSSLTIDLDARTFTAQASGIVLAGLPNPFTVQLGTDQASSCTMARVQQVGAGSYQLTAGDGTGEPCLIPDIPVAEPAAVLAGTPSKVTITVSSLANALDLGSAQVFRADGNGQPTSDPLCSLSDNGAGAYSCIVSFNEAAPAHVPLLVQATAAGQTILAPGFSLQVLGPATDATTQQLSDIANAIALAGQQSFGQFGDSVQARVQTLVALRKLLQPQPGLTGQPAGLTPDGLSIGVRSDAGLVVTFLLNNLASGPADNSGEPARPLRVGRSALPQLTASGAPNRPAPQCGQYLRDIVKNNKVLLWDPWSSFYKAADISGTLIQPLQSSKCPHFDVTPLVGPQADVASLSTFSQYGTIVMNTHGGIDTNNHFLFVTGEPYVFSNAAPRSIDDPNEVIGIACFILGNPSLPVLPESKQVGCFRDIYRYHPSIQTLTNTILYGAFCNSYSGRLHSALPTFRPFTVSPFPDAFAPAGSKSTYYGFDGPVLNFDTRDAGVAVFNSLLKQYSNTGDALAAANANLTSGAILEMHSDENLAYVGNPSLSSLLLPGLTPSSSVPPGGVLELDARLEGTSSCDGQMDHGLMSCKWTNQAHAGHLKPVPDQLFTQDNFTNIAGMLGFGPSGSFVYAQADYTANSGSPAGSDDITVDFFPDLANPSAAKGCATIGSPPKCNAVVGSAMGTFNCTVTESGGFTLHGETKPGAPYAMFTVTFTSPPSTGFFITGGNTAGIKSVTAEGAPGGMNTNPIYKMSWPANCPAGGDVGCAFFLRLTDVSNPSTPHGQFGATGLGPNNQNASINFDF